MSALDDARHAVAASAEALPGGMAEANELWDGS